ncbi:MAG: type II secretion system minor pseudopilin GspJ [Gammaproteobacteria bacterium]
MNRRTRAAGFTLLELLVALTIFAVLAVMAYGGLETVLDTRAQVEAKAAHLANLQVVYSRMEQDIQQTVARTIRDSYGDPRPALIGGTGQQPTLEFTRGGWTNPSGELRSTLQRVAYGLEKNQLVRLSWMVLDRAQDSKPYKQVMLDGVNEFRVRFLDQNNVWQDTWPPAGAVGPSGVVNPAAAAGALLPKGVEVTLELEHGRTIRWLFQVAS